ncbi:MAG: hypothetical protein L3J20_12540 [Flavobacteriaceae bacterium]|nr:hypothetical protein [Flavobacteriaceae bacterium]
MKNLLLSILTLILLSCGSTQKAASHLQTGNYIQAFNTSITKLNKDKTKKSNQKHIPLLKEAYTKAAYTDKKQIKTLHKENTPESLKNIYGKYLNLDIRQDEIRALQPLYYEGNEVTFKFDDYTDKIKTSKNDYSASLYNSAIENLKGDNLAARKAYKHLEDLIYINPDYKTNLNELLNKAKSKGSSFVYITLKNKVKSISKDSIKDFANINSANFSNQWVIYHHKKDRKINYDYQIDVTFDKLSFVPEKTEQQTVPQEAKVQDGWKYQLDGNGNVMKDDKGNDIKVAKYRIVNAEVALYQQNKSSKLNGTIIIKDLKKKTTLSTNPEFGEAKFQNTYGKYRGDQRAIEQKYHKALQAKEVPYPKDHEFVKYSISNFKQKVTAMLSQQQF